MSFGLKQVGFGQTVCTPLRPRCGICSISDLCPSAFKETSSPSSKGKKYEKNKMRLLLKWWISLIFFSSPVSHLYLSFKTKDVLYLLYFCVGWHWKHFGFVIRWDKKKLWEDSNCMILLNSVMYKKCEIQRAMKHLSGKFIAFALSAHCFWLFYGSFFPLWYFRTCQT